MKQYKFEGLKLNLEPQGIYMQPLYKVCGVFVDCNQYFIDGIGVL